MLQRIHRLDAAALSSWQALEMATRGGARAIGLGDELGAITVGRRADAILVNFDQVHLRPRLRDAHDNLVALLVWCAAWVGRHHRSGGRPRRRRGSTADDHP